MAAASSGAGDDYEEEKKPHTYATFEDYLDDQVTEEDKYYLGVSAMWPFGDCCRLYRSMTFELQCEWSSLI
jgi:hypothetical protein